MKSSKRGKILEATVLAMTIAIAASAQTHSNVVGYANSIYGIGDYLIANPLEFGADGNGVDDGLDGVMPHAPIGSTISLWSPSTDQFTSASTFEASGWSTDLSLTPGMGALLFTPMAFTNTWIGTVLNFNGSIYQGTFTQPPVYSGPNGLFLLASMTPIQLSDTNIFLDILGRTPFNGEQVITMNTSGQESVTTFENGTWNNGMPVLGVGDSAFLNVGPVSVPEPPESAMAFAGIATTLGLRWRRRKNSSKSFRALSRDDSSLWRRGCGAQARDR